MSKMMVYVELDDKELEEIFAEMDEAKRTLCKCLNKLEDKGLVLKKADVCETSAHPRED